MRPGEAAVRVELSEDQRREAQGATGGAGGRRRAAAAADAASSQAQAAAEAERAKHRQQLQTLEARLRELEEARAALEGLNPQNRLFQPAEVTAAALFLCGQGSEGINGQTITIAGGEV